MLLQRRTIWASFSALCPLSTSFYNIKMDEVDNLILEALSFYEKMTLNDIIMNLNEEKIQEMPYFNMLVLEERIKKLLKKKYIVRSKFYKEYRYQRQIPPRSLFSKLGF